MASLLIVDDEPVLLHQLSVALRSGGHEVHPAGTAAEALAISAEQRPDLVLLDKRLPDRSGLELIPELLARDAAMMIVLMTAYGGAEDAMEAMRRGAVDYLHKPLNIAELSRLIERLLREQRRERELEFLRSQDPPLTRMRPSLEAVLSDVVRLCDSESRPGMRPPILLGGEAGSGRHALAKQIHERLAGGPFIAYRCGDRARDAASAAEELFGIESGAPASGRSAPGLVEAAEGGTLFLEEIGALPSELQLRCAELLREGSVRRSCAGRARPADVHVLASSRSAIAGPDAVVEPALAELFGPLVFEVPSLRNFPDEIADCAKELAYEAGVAQDGCPRTLSNAACELLSKAPWPGNLRELRNVIECAIYALPESEISTEMLGPLLDVDSRVRPGEIRLPAEGLQFEDVERDLLRQALTLARGNRTRAASLLGMSRDTFRYRLTKLGIADEKT